MHGRPVDFMVRPHRRIGVAGRADGHGAAEAARKNRPKRGVLTFFDNEPCKSVFFALLRMRRESS